MDAGAAVTDKPRRTAALVMQTAMFTARTPGVPADSHATPLSVDEVWRFCVGGIRGAV